MKSKILIGLLLALSCTPVNHEYEFDIKVVKSKTVDFKDGSTRYNVAFENGESHAFTFGCYMKCNPGDTIQFVRGPGWFWQIDTIKQLHLKLSEDNSHE